MNGNAGEPILRARGLRYRAGSTAIIDGIDVDAGRGECVGIIGPNGAGKTTLLRMLAGLLPPSAGSVRLEGRDLAALESRARARRISFMSQETTQAFPFTVMETLLMGRYPHLKRFEQEGPDDRERARRMLSYVGLSGFEERSIGELSGGERQLVLFAKALVQDTDVLVLDEPSASLDIRHQDRIFSMARELAREGKAVVTSVHNLGVAAQYCSRLVLLDRGRVAAEGRAEHVLQSAILDAVYGIRTAVSSNAATGSLAVTVVPWRADAGGKRIHLIGGAGSAVNLTRELYRLGCVLSGGIAHEYDSDEKLWKTLSIECPTIGAFSRITDEDVAAAAPLVRAADLTILCSFPVGPGNLGNLKLAGMARSLVVVRTGPGDAPRGFVTVEGRTLFEELCSRGRLMLYEEVLAELERPRGA
jgi:iron complex transport system ATP-binding protein